MAADETNSHTIREGMEISNTYGGDYQRALVGRGKIKMYRKGGTFGQPHEWEKDQRPQVRFTDTPEDYKRY